MHLARPPDACQARLLGAALVAIALIVPAAAQAGPAWLPARDLSAAGGAYSGLAPQVALDPRGNAVAVWSRWDRSSDSEIVEAATRSAGGDWSQPQDLSVPAAGADSTKPQIGLDRQGNAVAIWRRWDGSNSAIQAAARPAGGGPVRHGWSAPQDVAAGGFEDPQLALDPGGNALAIWSRAIGGQPVIEVATRPAGGDWSQPQSLSPAGGYALQPQVALDPQGNATAVWFRFDGTTSFVTAATRPAGGTWSQPQDIPAASGLVSQPQVALDARGGAVAVWKKSTVDGLVDGVIQAAIRPPGQGWMDPESISTVAGNADSPQLALDPDGDAVAVWTNVLSAGSNQVIQAATRPVGKNWSAPQDVSSVVGNASQPQVALDRDGNAVAVWQRFNTTNFTIEAATRPASDGWSESETISGADLVDTSIISPDAPPLPQVALDAQGNAAAIWRRVGDQTVMKAAGYDAAGPQLRDLHVPAAGTAGSPLSFSVAPLDVWSPPASTPSWTFGDGFGASGASVSHSYASPGSYQVTVTSTDSLGNSSSERRAVVVSAAGTGSGGGGGSTTTPAAGGPQRDSEVGPAVPLSGSEAARSRGLRNCLARAARITRGERGHVRRGGASRRAQGRRRLRRHLRRRCLARYGRTPGRVTGVLARGRSKTRIVLSFRAPGSDGRRPPPARSYLIKQSLRPIRSGRSFRRARSLCGGACRVSVARLGDMVTLTITGLRPRTTYYYAVAARDNVSRRLGRRSRSVRARTR